MDLSSLRSLHRRHTALWHRGMNERTGDLLGDKYDGFIFQSVMKVRVLIVTAPPLRLETPKPNRLEATREEAQLKLLDDLTRPLVNPHDHGVIPLERLQSELLLGLDALFPQFGHFSCEHSLGGCG